MIATPVFEPVQAHRLMLPTNLQTVDEFDAWVEQSVTEGSYEFVDGRIIPKEAMKQNEAFIIKFLTRLFITTNAFREGDELMPEMDSYVDGRRKRVPDLTYLMAEQLQLMAQSIRQSTRFAIEILSDSESFEDVNEKISDYFTAGAALVWYIAPNHKTIYAYTSPDTRQRFQGEQTITAAPVVPDFQFRIDQLFA